MKRVLVRSIMFISSCFPLYVLLLVSQVDKLSSVPIWYAVNYILVLSLLMGISIVSVILLKKVPIGSYCKPTHVRKPDRKVIHYVLVMLLPAIGFSLDKPSTVIIAILWLLMWGVLYVKMDWIYMNPLWVLFGYVAYEYDGGYLVTDIPYYELEKLKENLRGCYLSNQVFVAHKKNVREDLS